MEALAVPSIRLVDIKINFNPDEYPRIWQAIRTGWIPAVKQEGINPLIPVCVEPYFEDDGFTFREFVCLTNEFYVYALKVVFGPDFKITVVEMSDMDADDHKILHHAVHTEADLQIALHDSERRRGRH
jgi:hypothetical protein